MTYCSDAEISNIYEGLLTRTLPKNEWTHAAHFAAACAIISDPKRDAFADMPDIIQDYNIATGVANTDSEGYHHTITLASLRAARHHSRFGLVLFETVNAVLESECGQSDWLFRYWSKKVLLSVQARRNWVEPDILQLPYV